MAGREEARGAGIGHQRDGLAGATGKQQPMNFSFEHAERIEPETSDEGRPGLAGGGGFRLPMSRALFERDAPAYASGFHGMIAPARYVMAKGKVCVAWASS